jgi:hypothetical protein
MIKCIFSAYLFLVSTFIISCKEQKKNTDENKPIANGQMPGISVGSSGIIHIVYGTGDSVMYVSSSDMGLTLSAPVLISVVHELAASHMRGPQIAATANGVTVIASNKAGDIFGYTKNGNGKWSSPVKVNDIDTVSKEGLMAMHADGQHVFAVWLDLRDKHNKIFGAGSNDGGLTWSTNKLVYASPDTTVCECCKPSVVVKGNDVYVMFRNWLQGNRDLYLIQSKDAGITFGKAAKLGLGSWKLDGCPMDGGGLGVMDNKIVQTVFRRQQKIYTCEAGKEEKYLTYGKGCTLTIAGNKPVYSWINSTELFCLLPNGIYHLLGKGKSQVMAALNNDKVAIVWENESKLYSQVLSLQ